MAERARDIANEFGLSIDVLDEARMEQEGMGSLLSVSRGSEQPAKLIILKYTPAKAEEESSELLTFVGKGVTFDSGGISLKPESNVTPLPTKVSSSELSSSAFAGVYLSMMSLAGCSEPRETLSNEPIPSCSMRASSRTSMLNPNSLAMSRARSAMSVGVMYAPGSLARSRVKLIASP